MTGPAQTIRFPVAGITCSSCTIRIIRALRRLPGVTKPKVDLRTDTVTLTRDPAIATDHEIVAALTAAGYQADLGPRP